MLHKSSCFATKKKQRLKNKLKGLKRQRKKRKQEARTVVKGVQARAKDTLKALNSKGNKLESKL